MLRQCFNRPLKSTRHIAYHLCERREAIPPVLPDRPPRIIPVKRRTGNQLFKQRIAPKAGSRVFA
jgi:hypothetical protein